MGNDEKAYLYWLHSVPKIGDVKMERLISFMGSARGVYYAADKQLLQVLKEGELNCFREHRKNWKVKEAFEILTEKGINMVVKSEEAYPGRLRKIKQAPYLLYYIGELPKEDIPAVAIIGARECSEYGAYTGKAFAERLATAGVSVISGMARGIDSIGQRAAVNVGGKTYAVLGCGVDVCYPASNQGLYSEIMKTGGILSPYLPGQRPQKTLFPYRNKLVAGLSDCVLVVEARQRSGTLITVDMALEQGKEVYAVPGRLTDRLSDGCNFLIRQGAGIALSPDDLVAELALLYGKKNAYKKQKKEKDCDKEKQGEEKQDKLMRFLDIVPKSADEILESVQAQNEQLSYRELSVELIRLCMEGKAKRTEGNYYVKNTVGKLP